MVEQENNHNLEQQDYITVAAAITDGPKCFNWKASFAWLPVRTITGKVVWLRRIYKRRYMSVWASGKYKMLVTEYADIFEILE